MCYKTIFKLNIRESRKSMTLSLFHITLLNNVFLNNRHNFIVNKSCINKNFKIVFYLVAWNKLVSCQFECPINISASLFVVSATFRGKNLSVIYDRIHVFCFFFLLMWRLKTEMTYQLLLPLYLAMDFKIKILVYTYQLWKIC